MSRCGGEVFMRDACAWPHFKRMTLRWKPFLPQPSSRKAESVSLPGDPPGLQPQNSQSICALLSECPFQDSLPYIQRRQIHHLGYFYRQLGRKAAALKPAKSSLTLLSPNEPLPGLLLFHITNKIPFMVLRKVKGLQTDPRRVEPPAGPFLGISNPSSSDQLDDEKVAELFNIKSSLVGD